MRLLLRVLPLTFLIVVATSGVRTLSPEASVLVEPPESGACYKFDTFTDDCGIGTPPDVCYGIFRITGEPPILGDGLTRSEQRTVPCQGCSGSVNNVPTAVDNPDCCDQDQDGYQRTECLGGTDCNDTPGAGFYIHPHATEICGDGIDNDCDPATEDGPRNCSWGDCPDTCLGAVDMCVYPITGCPSGASSVGFAATSRARSWSTLGARALL